MTDFCHISPTAYLPLFCANQNTHLALVHLVETDKKYASFYKCRAPGQTVIMDNSAFEMVKQGKEIYNPDKLMEQADKIRADYIVLPDFPGEPAEKTLEYAYKYAKIFRDGGFKTFGVPQSRKGDINGLVFGFVSMLECDLIDYIGISILAIPNAYGVLDNPLQRFYARAHFMHFMTSASDVWRNYWLERSIGRGHDTGISKKLHMLGMLDGPREIELMRGYLWMIDSWDSSAAIWAGLNGIGFDESPTGLIDGKFETEVDFNHTTARLEDLSLAQSNIAQIDKMIGEYS